MPAQRIIVLTTDGQNREDGNVYYGRYYLATATDSLTFSEPEFDTAVLPTFDEPGSVVLNRIRGYGYEVTEPGFTIVTLVEGNDLD